MKQSIINTFLFALLEVRDRDRDSDRKKIPLITNRLKECQGMDYNEFRIEWIAHILRANEVDKNIYEVEIPFVGDSKSEYLTMTVEYKNPLLHNVKTMISIKESESHEKRKLFVIESEYQEHYDSFHQRN